MTLLFWLIVSILSTRLQWHVTYRHRNEWNGFGTIEGTLNKTTVNPLIYRVLLPWLTIPLRGVGMTLENAYALIRIMFLWLALSACHAAFGFVPALMIALLSAATQVYDTWCYAPELFGIAAAVIGEPLLVVVGVVAWSLARETSPAMGAVYYAAGGDWMIGAALIVAALVIRWLIMRYQGKKVRYSNPRYEYLYPIYARRMFGSVELAANYLEFRRNLQWIVYPYMCYKLRDEPGFHRSIHLHLIVITLAIWGASYSPVMMALVFLMSQVGFWPVIGCEIRTNTWIYPWAALGLLKLVGG